MAPDTSRATNSSAETTTDSAGSLRDTLAQRIRLIFGLTTIAIVTAAFFNSLEVGIFSTGNVLRYVNLVFITLTVLAVSRIRSFETLRWTGPAAMGLTCGLVMATNVATGTLATFPSILAGVVIALSVLMPWGSGPQILLCTSIITSLATATILAPGSADAVALVEWARTPGLLILSVAIARVLEKERVRSAESDRLRLLREREIQDLNRSLEERVVARTEELDKTRARYEDLYDNAQDMYVTVRANDLTIERCNLALALTLGMSRKQLQGTNVLEFGDAGARRIWERIRTEFEQGGEVRGLEMRVRQSDGSLLDVSCHGQPELDADGQLVAMHIAWRDVSESRRARDELHAAMRRYRALAGRVATVREEEREAISREIHNELSQRLTCIKFDLAWSRKKLADQDEKILKRFDIMQEMVDQVTLDTSRIAYSLRPTLLDEFGISNSLDSIAREAAKQADAEVSIRLNAPDLEPYSVRDGALFRIAQEALNNAARHSGATCLTVTLQVIHRNVSLRIEDNGCGIHDVRSHVLRSSGMRGMHEAAAAAGGSLKVSSTRGEGTTVTALIPMEDAEAAELEAIEAVFATPLNS